VKNLPRPEAIFLDWDGTLVDSFNFLLQAHNHVRAIFSMTPFTPEQFNEYFGQPRELLYKNLYGKNGTEAKTHFEQFVVKHHLTYLKPMDGAETLIKTINNMKIKTGVVSNKKGEFVRREIEHFGWAAMLPIIVGAGEAPQDKPAADPLLLAMSLAGAKKPENVWYIGDSETDALCARNAGCIMLLIDHANIRADWIADYKPTLVVKNCEELSDFLLQRQ
jgi:phosphoglycolate phosphatase